MLEKGQDPFAKDMDVVEVKNDDTNNDLAIARKLWEEEKNKKQKINQASRSDEEIAFALQKEEEERQKKEEWDKAVRLLKEENDTVVAKLLKEKEDLMNRMDISSIESPSLDVNVQGVSFPPYWKPQVSDFQSFDVDPNSDEYKSIINHFHTGMPGIYVKRIERIQNKTLWTFYFLKRQLISKNNKNNPNEKYLFHGSRNDAYEDILRDGFDMRVANLGGAIGAGIYFGVSSQTSSAYVSAANGKSTHKMLYCRVSLGNVGLGKSGLRRPPEIPHSKKLFDSVGESTGTVMFCIFDNYQSIPEYCIHYQK